jgi:hypothetical protein
MGPAMKDHAQTKSHCRQSSGRQRSPTSEIRSVIVRNVKSAKSVPTSTSAHVTGAETRDERETARLPIRVEHVDQALKLLGSGAGADLDRDGIGDATEILDMGAVGLRGAHADPGKVRGHVVPATVGRDPVGLGLFVMQVQGFVAGEEIHPGGGGGAGPPGGGGGQGGGGGRVRASQR